MNAFFQALRFTFGLLIGIVGIALLVIALWTADVGYFHLIDTDFQLHDISIHGRPISVASFVATLSVIACALIAFAVLIVRHNHPFASRTHSN